MLNVLSLFSGIGAFEKALERERVLFKVMNFCEIDKYAVKSYCAIHGVSEQINLRDVSIFVTSTKFFSSDTLCTALNDLLAYLSISQ